MTSLLEGVAGIEVVGSAADGEEAVAFVDEKRARHRADGRVMPPAMGGLEAARRLREHSPNIRVVMLTSFSQHDVVVEAFDSGAVGYLLKDSAPDELINGIRAAARGDAPFRPARPRSCWTNAPSGDPWTSSLHGNAMC